MVFAMIVVFQLFASSPTASAQSKAEKPATGSISGIVTKDGKPATGVGVLLVERSDRGWGAGDKVERVRSDKDGKFTFEGLERGSYGLDAFLPGAFIQDSTPWDGPVQITLGDGESVTGVKLELERGGVITGRLVDDEGRPVAGEAIHLYVAKPTAGGAPSMSNVESREYTDDRGIYRLYGLSTGRYAVGAGVQGDEGSYGYGARTTYDLSFHGGSGTLESAKLIEVESGTEARNVDIVVRRGSPGFTITGRVVDAETRKPVTNVWIGSGPMVDGELRGLGGRGGVRDDGSFVLEGLAPGSYGVMAMSTRDQSSSYFCNPVELTVTDRDLKDVVVEMRRGATLRGVIVPLEADRGGDFQTVRNSVLLLRPILDKSDDPNAGFLPMSEVKIKPDLTFEANGLRVGSYHPFISPYSPVKGFYIARVEIDATPLSGPILIPEIKDVTNVRIVVGRTTSVLRGRVILRNGTVSFERVSVTLRIPGSMESSIELPLDAAGAFLLESAPPGDYEAVAASHPDIGRGVQSKPVKVSIGREGTVEVTIDLDLEAKPPSTGGAGGGQ